MEAPGALPTAGYAADLPRLPTAPRLVRLACLFAILGTAAVLVRVSYPRIRAGIADFEYFYKAGSWLWLQGTLDRGYDLVAGHVIERGTLDWYWPTVPRLMTLFAWAPQRPAGYAWLTLNTLALLATIRLIGRHLTGLPPRDWPVTQVLPLVLLLAYWQWEFRLNQINNFTLLLMVGGFVCWEQGRRGVAGFWLGLAVLLKLTPGLLVLWFALKRQYRTAAVAIVTVVLAGPVADVAALGPQRAAEAYREWYRNAVTHGSHAALVRGQREMDWRNQGLGAVLARWLHPTNYNTHFDNDPQVQARFDEYETKTMNVATLPLPAVAGLATAVAMASLAGLVWLLRRPARVLTPWQLRFEWALCLLAMLWLMPVMRRYHMIWALPALSLLGAGAHYVGLRRAWSWLALVCVLAAAGGQLALLYRPAEAGGSILATVAVLALPIILLLRRLGRNPAAMRAPVVSNG